MNGLSGAGVCVCMCACFYTRGDDVDWPFSVGNSQTSGFV